MWRNEPCGGSAAGSHFLSHLVPNKMERSRRVWAVVCNSAGWISTSDGKGEGRTILRVHCHSNPPILSIIHLLSSSVITALCPSLWSECERRDSKWEWMSCGRGIQAVCLFVHTCVCVSVHACVPAFYHVQISSSAAVSNCRAKRQSGDSGCWAPQGTDWALQAGILSIQPLQATRETGDGATDLLCLLVYCWASMLGGTAGLTGACANQSSIFASSSLILRVKSFLTLLSLSFHIVCFSFFNLPIYSPFSGLALSLTDLLTIFTPLFCSFLVHSCVDSTYTCNVLPTPVIKCALLFLRALSHGFCPDSHQCHPSVF